MKKLIIIAITIFLILFVLGTISKRKDNQTTPSEYKVGMHSGRLETTFGSLNYRVYFPKDFEEMTYVVHVSRGGTGLGNDLGKLMEYVNHLVRNGYVVIQVDHRNSGRKIYDITASRGEEIKAIATAVDNEMVELGDFKGTIDGKNQGFMGHSAGCLEGLIAAGVKVEQGDYYVPQIKAVYGLSPAGNEPDQYGIVEDGFDFVNETAVFLIVGEEEKDINGVRKFMTEDWRLQPYLKMNTKGSRFMALVKGDNTKHVDVSQNNSEIVAYNKANATVFFNTFLKGEDSINDIGKLALPEDNEIELSSK